MPANNALVTIEKLIREHKELRGNIQACEETISDIEQASKIDSARESLVPGRLQDHKEKAAKLEREVMAIEGSLTQHFTCEEESLLSAFESNKLPEVASALSKLISEHEHILKKLGEVKQQVAELAGDLSLPLWHEKAWRVRQEMYNVRQLIKEHSGKEDVLFKDAKKALQAKAS